MIQRLRVPLGFAAATIVLYFASPTGTTLAIGIPFALLGLLFRALAAGVIRKDHTLATSGPYALTRNPLYLGTFLLVLGFGIMSANPLLAFVLALTTAFVYSHVIKKEEEHLQRLFPDEFRVYRARVPAFFPRMASTRLDFSFQQYIGNREYNALMGFAGMLALFLFKWLTVTG